MVGAYWIAGVPVTKDDEMMAARLGEKLRETPGTNWYYPKVACVAQCISLKLRTEWLVGAFRPPNHVYELIGGLQACGYQLDDISASIIQALHEHRKYGVKPAYFQDGLIHTPSQAWVILDTEEARSQDMDPQSLNRECMAWFTLTDRDRLISLDTRSRTEEDTGLRRTWPKNSRHI